MDIQLTSRQWQYAIPVLYFMASLPIFNSVYQTSKLIIDEEFHIRQARHYCLGHFDVWDPKITTLPGLYILSSVLLPFQFCIAYYFRLLNLMASALNLFLLIQLTKKRRKGEEGSDAHPPHLKAITLSLLPPLYFFSHIYYTDTLSLTAVLGLFYCWKRSHHTAAAIFGFYSVLMRQTNILWVALYVGITVLDELILSDKNLKEKRRDGGQETLKDLLLAVSQLKDSSFLLGFISDFINKYLTYLLVVFGFAGFVLYNGSIVVGDKTAHEASVHLPQLFYFSIFCGLFSLSVVLSNLSSSLRIIMKYWKYYIVLLLVFVIIVKYNTITHPYLLADNRHYTFYVWNRFYGKYDWAKYAIIPAYLLFLTIIYRAIEHTSIQFRLGFFVACLLSLGLSRLIEVRYFIIPFVIWRINAKEVSAKLQILELLSYVFINFVTFYIFFTKRIRWEQYEEIQRIIW